MLNSAKKFTWNFLKAIGNLKLAISLLLTIAIASTLGTIIEQEQTISFYKVTYVENSSFLGTFLNWQVILFLGLDHVYKTWWFITLLVIFGASLMACSYFRQFPSLKTARQWRFYNYLRQLKKSKLKAQTSKTSLLNLAYPLIDDKYIIFSQRDHIYAYKGLLGRISPIIVHISIVLILIGSILASLQGFVAQELVPKGEIFHVQNLVNNGFFSVTTQQISSRINDFWIKYDSTNKISQFYSDLSLLNQSGHEIKRKIIYVNETLSYKNIVFYQTDWDILGLQAKINNSSTIQLPLAATTNNRSDNNLWRSFFLTDLKTNNGFSIIINDLTGRFSIYNIDGQMLQKSYLGSSNTVEGINFTISDIITSTGLQIKLDPGIPLIYTGFSLLIISVITSYESYSRIWAIQKANKTFIAGSTTRASLSFQQYFSKVISKLE